MAPIRNIRILIAPLDWGLGHATRCIPVIKALIERGIEVIIASEGPQAALLSSEFPAISVIRLPGYGIVYGRSGAGTFFGLFRQLPRFFRNIRRERQWLEQFCLHHRIDAMISDNRYGLHHPAIPSVFITHQLYIQTGLGAFADRQVFSWHIRQIRKFSACWVPDYPGDAAIAGALSNPPIRFSLPVTYIGPLTATDPRTTNEQIPLLIILSGPEPQRTIFENILFEQLKQFKHKVVFIRGLPQAEEEVVRNTGNIEIHNHLSREALSDRMCRAAYVIARCGYTTVMELMRMKKKSILVPTPGQPEQQYLARHLSSKKWILTATQKNFRLEHLLADAAAFEYRLPDLPPGGALAVALDQWLPKIRLRTDASAIQRKENL